MADFSQIKTQFNKLPAEKQASLLKKIWGYSEEWFTETERCLIIVLFGSHQPLN